MAFLLVVALLLLSHDHDNFILSETHSEARMRRQYMSSFYAVLVFSACFVQGYSLPQNRSDKFILYFLLILYLCMFPLSFYTSDYYRLHTQTIFVFFPSATCCHISNFKTAVFLIITKINAISEEKADEENNGDVVVSNSWEV